MSEIFVLVFEVPGLRSGFFKCKQYGTIVLEVAWRYEMQNKIKYAQIASGEVEVKW